MSFDLAQLGTLTTPDLTAEDWKHYETPAPSQQMAGGSSKMPVPEGIYTLRMPAVLSSDNLAKDSSGYLQLVFEPIIATGPFAGRPFGRKEYVSIKRFTNSKACRAGNLLRAAKISASPTTNEEWLKAFSQLAGKSFQAYVTWQGKDKLTGEYLRGEEKWPMIGGKRGGFIEKIDPKSGETYRIYANNEVNWFKTPPPPGTAASAGASASA